VRYKEVDAALADETYRRASKESFMEAWSVRLTRRRELFWRHTSNVDHISGWDRPCPAQYTQPTCCFVLRPRLDNQRRPQP
jgi:hypothetical protein